MTGLSRFRRFLADESAATRLPLGLLLAVAVALHTAVTLGAVNPWHPDEHFQILEFAWARAGLAPLAGLPWEFAAHLRPTLQPAIAMAVLGALRELGITSPYVWTTLLRFGTLALSLAVLLRAIAQISPTLTPRARRLLWLVALFAWYTPLFASRFTSENLGGLALVAALTFVACEGRTREGRARDDLVAGFFLGLAFVFRFQMAFAVVPVVAWVALSGAGSWARVARIGATFALVLAASTAVDSWFYGEWIFTPWVYFRVNIIEGVAARYGADPWWTYFVWAPLWTAPPAGLALIALVLYGAWVRRATAWSWAFAGYLLAHFVVAHKELRFLFPLMLFVPVFVAYAWDAIPARIRDARAVRTTGWILAVQNVALALILVAPSVHRGKEFDWHYFRLLWTSAEDAKGREVVVLGPLADPYHALDWSANVYRHPRVRGVQWASGDSLPAAVTDAARQARGSVEVFAVARTAAVPVIAGAAGVELVYEAEPGYRIMARWVGLEHSAFIQYLERVDNWERSQWVRRVFRVKFSS